MKKEKLTESKARDIARGALFGAAAGTLAVGSLPIAFVTALGNVGWSTAKTSRWDKFKNGFARGLVSIGGSGQKFNKNKVDTMLYKNAVKVPIVCPESMNPKMRQMLAQTQQARVVANLATFINNFINDKKYMTRTELRQTVRSFMQEAAASPAPSGDDDRKPLRAVQSNQKDAKQRAAPRSAVADEPPMYRDKESFGKRVFETQYSFVEAEFKNVNDESSIYRIPVKVICVPVPDDELVKVLALSLDISSPLSRFRSAMKGYISFMQLMTASDYSTFGAQLSKIAGANWLKFSRKTSFAASLAITSEMEEFLKEHYGIDLRNKHHLSKIVEKTGLLDIYIIDEESETIDICNYQEELRFDSFSLSQIYRSSKTVNDNSTIVIQQG